MAQSYIVHSVGSDDPHPFKHFDNRASAVTYAGEQIHSDQVDRTDIYAVTGATNPKAAVQAVRVGAAELIQTKSRHASEAEIEKATKRAWEDAQKAGPEATLKFLGR